MRSPLDRFRADPDNWLLGFIYFCRADRRLIISRRRNMGFTLNFARPLAVPFLFLVLVIATAPLETRLGPSLERYGLLFKVAALLLLFVSANRFTSR